jgi:hypothetical protein
MQFMLNQFHRNSRHVGKLSCDDVPIFLEEIDEREFLFGIQIVAYMGNLERVLRGQWNYLTECVLWLDGRLGLGNDWVWGEDFSKACFNSWSSADAISLSAISQLSLSQSKVCFTSPLMEITPHIPGIFKTK